MGKRITADSQSSASSVAGSTQTRNANLLGTAALKHVHRSATVHIRKDGTLVDPLENWTVALWEDLYHKVLLKGYSNNSQWPANNETLKKMDIGTYYFGKTPSDELRRMALVFTEAKRASNAESTKKGHTLLDLEEQLAGYCSEWLFSARPLGAENQVYANAVVGQYIQCFVAEPDKNKQKVVVMTDINGKVGCSNDIDLKRDYLDVGNAEDQVRIRAHFQEIRDRHPPELLAPCDQGPKSPSSSRSSPSAGNDMIETLSQRTSTPPPGPRNASAGVSPMSISTSGSPSAGSRPATAPRTDRSAEAATYRRSASPPNQPTRSIRQRSPQNSTPDQ